MPDAEVTAFAQLAGTSARVQNHAYDLIKAVVGPATERLREAGGLRADITVDDIALFIRMADATDTHEQRVKATEVLLAGLTPTASPTPGRTRRVTGAVRPAARRPRRST